MIGHLADGQERVPKLPPALRQALAGITASGNVHPCQVTLNDGSVRDHVYVAEADAYIRVWGVWPWEDPGKNEVSITDVASVEDSPGRLPAELARRLYEAGESMMGGCRFLVLLQDGRRFQCLTGNAVDFLDGPPGVTPHQAVDVVPHSVEETDGTIRGASYSWCLYRDDDSSRR